jgi:hypothetical protein
MMEDVALLLLAGGILFAGVLWLCVRGALWLAEQNCKQEESEEKGTGFYFE